MKSFRTRILIMALLAILVVSNSMSIFIYTHYKKIMLQDIQSTLKASASETAFIIDDFMKSHVSRLLQLAATPAITSMNPDIQLSYLSSLSPSGFATYSVYDLNGNRMDAFNRSMNVSKAPFFTSALQGEIYFSDVVMTSEGAYECHISVPIQSNLDVIGVLVGTINLEDIFTIISNKSTMLHWYAYLINNRGNFIAHSNMDVIDANANVYDLARKQDKYQDFYSFWIQSQTQDSGHGGYAVDDQLIQMGYAKLQTTSWYIYVGATEAVVFENIHAMRNYYLAVAIVLNIIAVLITIWITKSITSPIIALDQALIQASEGQLDIRLPVSRDDELGRVFKNFNRMMNTIRSLTYIDPVTHLENLSVLESELKNSAFTAQAPQYVNLMLVSIDQFSLINETYGYHKGDSLLKSVAKRIQDTLSINGQIYRGKGDEFMLTFPMTTPFSNVVHCADELLEALKHPFLIDSRHISVRFSIGIDRLQIGQKENTTYFTHVTHAKNTAKSEGGQRVVIYNENDHMKMLEERSLSDDLVDAVATKAFFVVYQPLMLLEHETIVDAEALIRWKHPSRGFVPPDVFINLAEKMGIIAEIDYWVIEEVLKQQALWLEKHTVSINISALTFSQPDFLTYLTQRTAHYGLTPSKIQLELTERVILENINKNIEQLKRLRDLGYHIAIDDFGIGYSSLNYIVQLPLDVVKIDKSFIQDMKHHHQSKVVVSTIITMCTALGLKVVAEGVEDSQTVQTLKNMGCHIGQGYHYSKPVPPNEFI